MFRIIVFSDTHKNIEPCIKLIENIKDIDMIIHAGDHWSDARELEGIFPDIPVKYVKGNCDFALAPLEELIETEGKKIFVTHGHLYNAKSSLYHLFCAGKEEKADIVVFGHTHMPLTTYEDGVYFLNPGSCSGYKPSYGFIDILDNGDIVTNTVTI